MSRNRSKGNEKKKHHFIPKAYLRHFVNDDGKLRVYLKDRPEETIWSRPDETAFRNFYYSQPKSGGEWNNNSIEDFFGRYETKWSAFLQVIRDGKFDEVDQEFLYEFMAMQVARTPAIRDSIELMLADLVLFEARKLNILGKLPTPPEGFKDILNHVGVSIDPHMSIRAMSSIVSGFSELLNAIGLCIVRNETGIPFVTSDNPIIWFDPTLPENLVKPHHWRRDGPVLFIYPIAPDLLILGSREARENFVSLGLFEGQRVEIKQVNTINRAIARFSYQAFYCSTDSHKTNLEEFADSSPTIKIQRVCRANGIETSFEREFGPRRKPIKWREPS